MSKTAAQAKPSIADSIEAIAFFRSEAKAAAVELEAVADAYSSLASEHRSAAAKMQSASGNARKSAKKLRGLL